MQDEDLIPTEFVANGPYSLGLEAFNTNKQQKENPYPQGSYDFEAWEDGWSDAEYDDELRSNELTDTGE